LHVNIKYISDSSVCPPPLYCIRIDGYRAGPIKWSLEGCCELEMNNKFFLILNIFLKQYYSRPIPPILKMLQLKEEKITY
jgi:hypothetical protein